MNNQISSDRYQFVLNVRIACVRVKYRVFRWVVCMCCLDSMLLERITIKRLLAVVYSNRIFVSFPCVYTYTRHIGTVETQRTKEIWHIIMKGTRHMRISSQSQNDRHNRVTILIGSGTNDNKFFSLHLPTKYPNSIDTLAQKSNSIQITRKCDDVKLRYYY